MQFWLEGGELAKYEAWQKEHDKTCKFYDDGTKPVSPQGAIGGRTTFSFTPTGLGAVVVVKCACGEEVNVTDYENW